MNPRLVRLWPVVLVSALAVAAWMFFQHSEAHSTLWQAEYHSGYTVATSVDRGRQPVTPEVLSYQSTGDSVTLCQGVLKYDGIDVSAAHYRDAILGCRAGVTAARAELAKAHGN